MDEHFDEVFDSRTALTTYASEIARLQRLLNYVFVDGSQGATGRAGIVILCLLISCKDIVEETLYLVKGGFGGAAVRGVRTMYECIVSARYLSRHPEKADALLDVFNAQWAKIMQNVPRQYRDAKMDGKLAAEVPKYGAGKFLSTTDIAWSDTHLLKMAREAGAVVDLHPYAFDQASAYIHPSSMYVVQMLKMDPETKLLGARTRHPVDEKFALRLAHDLALNALDLRLKTAPDESTDAAMEQCLKDFREIWGYKAHI